MIKNRPTLSPRMPRATPETIQKRESIGLGLEVPAPEPVSTEAVPRRISADAVPELLMKLRRRFYDEVLPLATDVYLRGLQAAEHKHSPRRRPKHAKPRA
jgi:hypothetical protein